MKNVTVRAEVDWLRFEIETVTPTNFWTLEKCILQAQGLPDAKDYVKQVNPGAGGACSRFQFAIQDPESPKKLERIFEAINSKFPLTGAPVLVGMEVAIDFYGAGPEFLARLIKFAASTESQNRRLYRKKGETEDITHNLNHVATQLAAGKVIGIGDRTDDFYQRGYWKTHDRGAPIADKANHRARFETRTEHSRLPDDAQGFLEGFDFKTFGRCFKFRKPKDGLAPLQSIAVMADTRIGERRVRNRRGGGTRLHSGLTVADSALNKRVSDALGELTRRWQQGPKRSRRRSPRTEPNDTACGNLRDKEAGTRAESSLSHCFIKDQHQNPGTRSNTYIHQPICTVIDEKTSSGSTDTSQHAQSALLPLATTNERQDSQVPPSEQATATSPPHAAALGQLQPSGIRAQRVADEAAMIEEAMNLDNE